MCVHDAFMLDVLVTSMKGYMYIYISTIITFLLVYIRVYT